MRRLQPFSARLGLAVGVFFFAAPQTSQTQVVVPPGSEIPIPPKPKTDSAQALKPDTTQPPFGRSFGSRTADIGPQYQWGRSEMFASGALTVADLLERVPGMTSFRSGWLASPKYLALNGDLNRVRIYYDGIEMDNLDPGSAPILDLTTIELWTLENVQVERFANELTVYLRSWQVDKTDPYTRIDVFTGDENTNFYRGFYGRRFRSGAGLQLGAQQFSTRAVRLGGGGDALSLMGRVGIARRGWSVDAFALRRSASRVIQPTFSTTGGLSLPPFEGTHSLVYLRAAVGNPAGGPWAQLVASHMQFADKSKHITPSEAFNQRLVADTTDTTTARFQYLASAGMTRGPLRASVSDRIRAFEGNTYHAPTARLELANDYGIVGLHAETDALLRTKRADLVGRLTPVPYIAIAGAMSVSRPYDGVAVTALPHWTAARLEAGIRLLNPWLIGGFVTRDTAVLAGPMIFDTAYKAVRIGRRQGLYAGLRGKLYKDINLDIVGTRWDSAGFYQPRYQARSEINLVTNWSSRFPSGNFGLKVAFVHDYRSRVLFPTASGNRIAVASGVMSGLLEIRILRGVASYQLRNIVGENYQLVPEFFMPRAINVYGIRWEFWN